MFDFSLSNINSDQPTPIAILYALLLSFILATCISFTYERTSGHNRSPGHFIQSMILGSIIAAVVAQAIGDSIGKGLGLLGILAMIRFRTNLNQPRNMIFIFAALAVGLACGVFAFNIALYGTIMFCIVAFLMELSPLSNYPKITHSLRIGFQENDADGEKLIEKQLENFNIKFELIRLDINASTELTNKEYIWELKSKSGFDEQELINKLKSLENVKTLKLNMRSEEESI